MNNLPVSAIDLFIHPGEYEFADHNFCIRTTLGSCVSIVLWHPDKKIGGMCHYMLPGRTRPPDSPLNGKYADEALELLLIAVRKHHTHPREYEVKIFGGGNMFPAYHGHGLGVAERNIQTGRQLLAAHGLSIKSQNLGGNGYRNVIFDIASGDVWVRRTAGAGHQERSVKCL